MKTTAILAAVLPLLAAPLVPGETVAHCTGVSAGVSGSAAPAVQSPALSGRWTLRMISGQVTVEGTLQIEQHDGTIEGTWRPADDPDAEAVPVSGRVTDETLSLSFDARVPPDADSRRLELVGEMGDDLEILAGTFSAPGGASGEWTARRAYAARATTLQTSLFSIA